jgi:hypothetical protein
MQIHDGVVNKTTDVLIVECLDLESRKLCNEKVQEISSFSMTFMDEWEKFAFRNKAYSSVNDEKSCVVKFWDNYDHIQNLLLLRCQRAGLCYMHAPIVLQHYLVTIATKGTSNGIVDLDKYEADTISKNIPTNLALENGASFLYNICNLRRAEVENVVVPSSESTIMAQECVMEKLIKKIRDYPALVYRFTIYDDFFESDSLRGTPKGKVQAGFHAMVLIGDFFFIF